jgi:stage III sporulation protein AE
MDRKLTAILLLVTLVLCPAVGLAEGGLVDTTEIEREWQALQQQYGQYLPEFDWRSPGSVMDFGSLFSGLLLYLFHEVWANAALLGQLLLLAVFGSLLKNLQNAFSNDGVAQVSRAVLFLVLLSVCMYSFTISMDLARRTVMGMTDFMLSLVPVMLALLAGMGSLAAAAVFQPVMITAAGIVGVVVSNLVLPLLFAAAVLALVDKMLDKVGLNKLAGFLKDGVVWLLSLLLTLFVGVTVINGAVAAVADGVAFRTGKFTAKAFIPVVGGMFADAFETVVGASLVLKNSVGVFGMIGLLVLCMFPILKLFAVTLIYRGAAALLQPLGEDAISDTLDIMAKYMYVMIGAVVGVAIMFFLVVTIILAAANIMVMVR